MDTKSILIKGNENPLNVVAWDHYCNTDHHCRAEWDNDQKNIIVTEEDGKKTSYTPY